MRRNRRGPHRLSVIVAGPWCASLARRVSWGSLEAGELRDTGFIEIPRSFHQSISVKLFTPLHSQLHYREDSKMASLQSRDPRPLEVISVDFLVDNTQLGFSVSA